MYLTTIEVWTVFIPFIISYLRMCIYHVPGLIFLWKNTFLEPIHADLATLVAESGNPVGLTALNLF